MEGEVTLVAEGTGNVLEKGWGIKGGACVVLDKGAAPSDGGMTVAGVNAGGFCALAPACSKFEGSQIEKNFLMWTTMGTILKICSFFQTKLSENKNYRPEYTVKC